MGLLKEGSVTILAPRSTALYGVEYFHAEIQRQAQPQAAGAPLPPPPPPPPAAVPFVPDTLPPLAIGLAGAGSLPFAAPPAQASSSSDLFDEWRHAGKPQDADGIPTISPPPPPGGRLRLRLGRRCRCRLGCRRLRPCSCGHSAPLCRR